MDRLLNLVMAFKYQLKKPATAFAATGRIFSYFKF